jgi:hypothetical protein
VTEPASLLTRLQRLIENSYDWNTGIDDLGPFVVGDEGYRALYRSVEFPQSLSEDAPAARTVVSFRGAETRLGVYYPDALVIRLELHNPLLRVDDGNVGAFAVLVEELHHLLMLAWCSKHQREVGLLELEFHANVTKYLVLAHFVARHSSRTRLEQGQKSWLLHRLFDGDGEELPPPFRHRYRTAARLAVRFILLLEGFSREERVRSIRRVARRPWKSLRSCLESRDPARGLRLLLAL